MLPKLLLFKLMYSHQRLAQAEYDRNPSYNDSHFSAVVEKELIEYLGTASIEKYMDYVDKQEAT